MPEEQRSEADLAFEQLEAVTETVRQLRNTMPGKRDFQGLHRAYQDLTAALAEAAFTKFPADPRRWDAAAIALRQSAAFHDRGNDAPEPEWQARTAEMQTEILAAPDASTSAVGAALSLGLNGVEKISDAPAFVDSLDAHIVQIERRLPDPALLNRAYSMLIGKLEQLGDLSVLGARLERLAADGSDQLKAFARGRLAALAGRDTPLEFTFEDLTGQGLNIADLRGEVVLLQYWASWCGPCRAEIPHLRDVYAHYHERGFHIIGLSLDEMHEGEDLGQARSRVARFMKDNDMAWRTQFDGLGWNNPLAARFGVLSIPASLLLDKAGRVAAVNLRGDALGVQVERLIAT